MYKEVENDIKKWLKDCQSKDQLPQLCRPYIGDDLQKFDHNFVDAVRYYNAMGITTEHNKRNGTMRVNYPVGWKRTITGSGFAMEVRDDNNKLRLSLTQKTPTLIVRRFGIERTKEARRSFVNITSPGDRTPIIHYETSSYSHTNGDPDLTSFKKDIGVRATEWWGMERFLEIAFPDIKGRNPLVYWDLTDKELQTGIDFLKQYSNEFLNELVQRSVDSIDTKNIPEDRGAKTFWDIIEPHMEALAKEYKSKLASTPKVTKSIENDPDFLSLEITFNKDYEANLSKARAATKENQTKQKDNTVSLKTINKVRNWLSSGNDILIFKFEGTQMGIINNKKLKTDFHECTEAFNFEFKRHLTKAENKPEKNDEYLDFFRNVANDSKTVYLVRLNDDNNNPVPIIISSNKNLWDKTKEMGVSYSKPLL